MFGVSDIDGLLMFHKHHTDRIGPRDVQHMMMVEYKTYGAKPPMSQHDSLSMLSQALCKVSKTSKRKRSAKSQPVWSPMAKRNVTLKTWGAHLLVFSATSPADSSAITWNGKQINTYDLECLLRFELNPWTLKALRDRRHHTVNG